MNLKNRQEKLITKRCIFSNQNIEFISEDFPKQSIEKFSIQICLSPFYMKNVVESWSLVLKMKLVIFASHICKLQKKISLQFSRGPKNCSEIFFCKTKKKTQCGGPSAVQSRPTFPLAKKNFAAFFFNGTRPLGPCSNG